MQDISSVSFSGVFALRDGVSEKEFLPRLHAFFQHFIDMGFATGYRVMRREALDDFGKTLPAFAYRGELIYPDLEREHAAYEYVKQHGKQVNSLHVAMNSLVKPDADFFFGDAHRIEHECPLMHETDMPTALSDVRSWGSGKHLLATSISGFDPTRTLGLSDIGPFFC
jgi:hypothetical protein